MKSSVYSLNEMSAPQTLCLALVILLPNVVRCTDICDFTDEVCMTKSANYNLKSIIRGIDGKVESSDPLHYDMLEGEVQSLKYKLKNITLTGLINCEITLLVYDIVKITYNFFWRCPQLSFSSYYELKGSLGTFQVNGKGTLTVTSGEYIIKFHNGDYGAFIDEKDKLPRLFLKNSVQDIEIEPKGKIDINIDNLIDGDKEKSELAKKYLNENWRQFADAGKPIMKVLLMKLIMNISDYLKLHHLEKVVGVLET